MEHGQPVWLRQSGVGRVYGGMGKMPSSLTIAMGERMMVFVGAIFLLRLDFPSHFQAARPVTLFHVLQ